MAGVEVQNKDIMITAASVTDTTLCMNEINQTIRLHEYKQVMNPAGFTQIITRCKDPVKPHTKMLLTSLERKYGKTV